MPRMEDALFDGSYTCPLSHSPFCLSLDTCTRRGRTDRTERTGFNMSNKKKTEKEIRVQVHFAFLTSAQGRESCWGTLNQKTRIGLEKRNRLITSSGLYVLLPQTHNE